MPKTFIYKYVLNIHHSKVPFLAAHSLFYTFADQICKEKHLI